MKYSFNRVKFLRDTATTSVVAGFGGFGLSSFESGKHVVILNDTSYGKSNGKIGSLEVFPIG
jgi:hypothetical protein